MCVREGESLEDATGQTLKMKEGAIEGRMPSGAGKGNEIGSLLELSEGT